MPDANTEDDDDSGSLGDFLGYRVWKLRGWMIVGLAFILGLIARAVLY